MTNDHRSNGMSNGNNSAINPTHRADQALYPYRPKQVRATQACNHCRERKQKCDEARPCEFCRGNNFDCQYKDVPPPPKCVSMSKRIALS
jgi:hypothetical protein